MQRWEARLSGFAPVLEMFDGTCTPAAAVTDGDGVAIPSGTTFTALQNTGPELGQRRFEDLAGKLRALFSTVPTKPAPPLGREVWQYSFHRCPCKL